MGTALADHADAVCRAVDAFVRTTLDKVLDQIGIDHAVVDFAWRECTDGLLELKLDDGNGGSKTCRYSVVVLELNSFGFRSSGALFDWRNESDCKTLFEGPGSEDSLAEFRTVNS